MYRALYVCRPWQSVFQSRQFPHCLKWKLCVKRFVSFGVIPSCCVLAWRWFGASHLLIDVLWVLCFRCYVRTAKYPEFVCWHSSTIYARYTVRLQLHVWYRHIVLTICTVTVICIIPSAQFTFFVQSTNARSSIGGWWVKDSSSSIWVCSGLGFNVCESYASLPHPFCMGSFAQLVLSSSEESEI